MPRSRKQRKYKNIEDNIPYFDYNLLFITLQKNNLSENDFIDMSGVSKKVMQTLRHNGIIKSSTMGKIINGLNKINGNKETDLNSFITIRYKQ